MPTRDRRHYAFQAIQYFLRQDYRPRELVVLDDGNNSISDLIPADPRIRYVRLPAPLPVDAKRNIGCELAAGELIAHWEDDDWAAASRLSTQVHALLSATADACVIDRVYHYDPARGQAWQEDPGVAMSGTLVYRRELWKRWPHDPAGHGNNAGLLAQGHVAAVAAPCYVAIDHPGKAISRNGASMRSARRPVYEIAWLLGTDADFYVTLRTRRPPHSAPAPPRMSPVHLVAPVFVYDGLGSMGEYLALGMARAGAMLALTLLRHDLEGTTPELQELVGKRQAASGDPTVVLAWWGDSLDRYRGSPLFINTMWETSRVPADWPARLNLARTVIVPTRFVADVFRSCGVTVPVEVVPQGVDPAVYHLEERPERTGLTTLMVGVVSPRKNVTEGIMAWRRAFADDPDARLVIKSRFGSAPRDTNDDRIRFVDSNETTRGIAHWYREADVLMALGNEGFGLPLVEAMATGLPVIALDTEGQSDVCGDARELVLSVPPGRWERVVEAPFGDCGVRAIPDVDAVTARLRWIAGHRDEAAALGREASAWTIRHRDVWDMGPAILGLMETRLRPSRILRQPVALCCPEGSAVLARFARRLARAVPIATVIGAEAGLARSCLLHIQHEPGTWDDEALLRLTRQARYSGMPVIVTEHVVGTEALAWEREADAIVVHTEREAAVLTDRWPGLRVEMIPVACPPWSGRDEAAVGALRSPRVAVLCLNGETATKRDAMDQLAALNGFDVAVLSITPAAGGAAGWPGGDGGEDLARLLHDGADVVVAGPGPARDLAAIQATHGAVASGVPIVALAPEDLAEIGGAAHRPVALAEGVIKALDDQELRAGLRSAARAYCAARTWEDVSQRHRALWRSFGCG
jgi:glycosyltransferase involved in cell wall biosynthesis